MKKRDKMVKTQVRDGMIEALQEGYQYGKGHTMFHMTKSKLHEASHASRYKDNVKKRWLKKSIGGP